jgi:hypothetical protein
VFAVTGALIRSGAFAVVFAAPPLSSVEHEALAPEFEHAQSLISAGTKIDPSKPSMLSTLRRYAAALGREVRIFLIQIAQV